VLGDPSIAKGLLTMSYSGGSGTLWTVATSWRLGRTTGRFALAKVVAYQERDVDVGDWNMREIDPGSGRGVEQRIGPGFSARRFACKVAPGLATPDLAAFDFDHALDALLNQPFVEGSCRKRR
jgi:hypothetical protein